MKMKTRLVCVMMALVLAVYVLQTADARPRQYSCIRCNDDYRRCFGVCKDFDCTNNCNYFKRKCILACGKRDEAMFDSLDVEKVADTLY